MSDISGVGQRYLDLARSIRHLATSGHKLGHKCLPCAIATHIVLRHCGPCDKYGDRGRCGACVSCNATEYIASF